MTDTDATRKRHYVADPLREYIAKHDWTNRETDADLAELTACVYAIETEHERRMDQVREDSRKATCNYLSRIIADYKRGKKWKRKEYPNEQKH